MCGFIGIFLNNSSRLEEDRYEVILKKMSKVIERRGPNDQGIFINKENKLGLAFQRLSILDLNKNANQPMISNNKAENGGGLYIRSSVPDSDISKSTVIIRQSSFLNNNATHYGDEICISNTPKISLINLHFNNPNNNNNIYEINHCGLVQPRTCKSGQYRTNGTFDATCNTCPAGRYQPSNTYTGETCLLNPFEGVQFQRYSDGSDEATAGNQPLAYPMFNAYVLDWSAVQDGVYDSGKVFSTCSICNNKSLDVAISGIRYVRSLQKQFVPISITV